MAERFNPVPLIIKKREGLELTAAEVSRLIEAFLEGAVADYQLSAWLMAVFFRGMTAKETVALTEAMLHSGEVLDLSALPGKKVDKHSTGGVGDKISLCLAPLVAACGVTVPMISGRGLGHTGGTLDKLEAIPGYDTQLSPARFRKTLKVAGASIIGQTARLAPADRRIYALRDVTGTVECIPLIVASILSKKLAAGLDGLVLDVKVGRGAFMETEERARELATALVRVGKRAGKQVVALLTAMDSPIGTTIGNGLEVREAIEVLQNAGPADTRELTLALGAEMLRLGGVAKGEAAARRALEQALRDGSALRHFEKMVQAHGGDPRVASDPSRLPQAPFQWEVASPKAGYVQQVDSRELALVALDLGAGRTRADQPVDHAVGLELLARPGDAVKRGQPLLRVHARTKSTDPQLDARLLRTFALGREAPAATKLVIDRITG